MRASIQRRALTNCSQQRCGLLSGISSPDLFLDLQNSSLAKTCEKFWLIAGHFSRKTCTTGRPPRCSLSKQSHPTEQSLLLWLMEVLPPRLSSGVPVKVFSPAVAPALSRLCFPMSYLPSQVSSVFLGLPLVNVWLQHIIRETRAWY